MRRRLIAHIEAGGTTDLAPETLSVPASVYTDPTRFAVERHEIFGELPLLAGLSGDIARPGDLMLFDAAGLKVSRTMLVKWGPVTLPRDLPRGRSRELVREELDALLLLVGVPRSSSREKRSKPARARSGSARAKSGRGRR